MANLCEVCGHPCGWWRTVHPECEPLRQKIAYERAEQSKREEPTLFSFNGIGTRMYGRARYDEVTDSYVATQWFCVFWIPVAPLARYRVIHRGWRTWDFVAQVVE